MKQQSSGPSRDSDAGFDNFETRNDELMTDMQIPLWRRHTGRFLLTAGVAACVCALVTGCQIVPQVYPEVKRRTLTELYYEALAASQNVPDRNGAVCSTPPQMMLPPATHANRRELTPFMNAPAPVPVPTVESEEKLKTSDSVPLLPESGVSTDARAGWRAGRRGQQQEPRDGTSAHIRNVSHTETETATAVTDFFESVDIRQALQSIASQANKSIIIDEQVGGVVNAVIEDEPFESALRKILLPLGLVSRKTPEGEYLVGIPDPASPLFGKISERTEYRPLHLAPEELNSLIPERDQKFIQIVNARNRILIEAPKEIGERILDRLQQLDSPIPQVELEAIVCVIAPDTGFRSGLDWNHAVSLNGSEVFNFGLAGLTFAGQGSGAGFSSAFSDFSVTSAFVKLLAQEGYLAIRAAPRVTARDGDQARISITRESFFSTQPQSDQVFFRQEIKQVDAGIELDITPVIRGDNITVKIEKAEVSEDIRTSQVNSAITENPFPQINRRTVSTTVHVKDGETVVIGGLVQRQTVDRLTKVPVLGDIPGLGRVFQTVEQKEQDAEVVIFISPRLVQPTTAPSM